MCYFAKNFEGMISRYRFFSALLLLLFLVQCAKRASPTGGPKDSIPPVLINASPKMNTVFFDKDEIRLTFNEFVKLKDVNKQLIISPPIERSKYTVNPTTGASKKVVIKLLDSLIANTTYTFNFGESIQDFNEGNTSPYLTYTLSTGAQIDSLYVRGKVDDAFEEFPESFISLHLYPIDSTHTDSTIYHKKPFFVTSTLDTTLYKFQNIRAGKYQLIALEDVAGNYLFDQNVDKIGFLEHPIELPQDSIINLRLFKEKTNFAWEGPTFINDHHIALAYFGAYEEQAFRMVSEVPDDFEFLVTKDREKDSLNYWFNSGETVLDSLKFELEILDTLRIKKVQFKNPIKDSLVISAFTKGNLDLTQQFELQSNLPIVKTDSTQLRVFHLDTVPIPARFKIQENYDRIYVHFEVLPNDSYQIKLFPNALQDFWGHTHDTLSFKVRTKKIEDYGNIALRLVNHYPESPIIVQLLNNDKVVRYYDEKQAGNLYSFNMLSAGKYRIRLILDTNGNKKWDTGNYLKKIQPEEVIYFWKEIELRANWDMNETFNTIQNYPDLPESATASVVLEVPDN